jgi:RNA polymerase sigma-70 factor (sigma-E family)
VDGVRQRRRTDDQGRRTALIALYDAERDAMVRLAHLLTGSPALAEDVVQDAFVKLHDGLDDVREPGAYLRRTVINLCHSHHRRADVERRWRDRQPPAAVVLPPDVDDTWRAVRDLPERQRQVLVLRFYLDMKVDDIAAALDVPPGTVKSTIHRGLAALAEEITR